MISNFLRNTKQLKRTRSLEEELEQSQQALAQSQKQSQQLETECDRLKDQLQQLETERDRLKDQLQQSQQELEHSRDQAEEFKTERDRLILQLHNTQEELEIFFLKLQQVEAEFTKFKLKHNRLPNLSPKKPSEYYLLVFDAWSAYYNGQKKKMIHYLQLSLKYTSFYKTETILDWINCFHEFAMEQGKSFNTKTLIDSQEWKKLTQRFTLNKSI